MSDQQPSDASGAPERVPEPAPAQAAEPEWVRKRRLAEIFGDVLPETTRDEREDGPDRRRTSDDWLKAQVPPHHGG